MKQVFFSLLLVIQCWNSYGQKVPSAPLIEVLKDDKWGMITFEGKIIVSAAFSNVEMFDGETILVAKGGDTDNYSVIPIGGKRGFYNREGKLIIPIEYEYAKHFSEGLAAVRMDKKWGFIDKENKKKVPCIYEKVYSFSEGLAAVRENGNWGFVDENHKMQIPCIYTKASSFSEGLAVVKADRKWGVIDKNENWIVPPVWDLIEDFENGVAVVAHIIGGEEEEEEEEEGIFLSESSIQYGNYGLLNKDGVLLLDTIYEYIGHFRNGYAAIKKDGKSGFINTKGEIVVPIQFDRVTSFSEGMAAVANYQERPSYHNFGYNATQIDSLRNLVAGRVFFGEPSKEYTLQKEAYEKAQLQESSKELVYGYINEVGTLVIPFQFDNAEVFKNGLAITKRGYKYLRNAFLDKAERIAYQEQVNLGFNLVDKNGQLQWTKNKRAVKQNTDNVICIVDENGASAYTYTDEMIESIAPQYESLRYLGDNYYAVVVKETQQLKIVGNGLDLLLDKAITKVKGVHQNIFLVEVLAKDKEGRSSKKMGLIDAKGKWVIEPIYDNAYER